MGYMKILVLGGTSFTGPHIVRGLVEEGHEVHYLHRGQHMPPPLGERLEGAKPIYADMSNLGPYKAALRQLKFDVVVNMIALSRQDAFTAIDVFAGHTG